MTLRRPLQILLFFALGLAVWQALFMAKIEVWPLAAATR